MATNDKAENAEQGVFRADMGEAIPTQSLRTATDAPSGAENAADVDATDAARRLAEENEINLRDIEGSGVDRRVTVEDVRAAIAERDGE